MTTMPPDQGGPDSNDSAGSNREPEVPRWARKPAANAGPLTEDRLAAYIGPKWESVYRRKLQPFLDDPTFVPTWNWSAALANLLIPSSWFLYRKLYFPFAIFFLVPGIALGLMTGTAMPSTVSDALKPENQWLITMGGAVQLSAALAAGGSANWFLFRRARAASVFVSNQDLPAGDDAALMRRLGGVNRGATALFIGLMLVLTAGRLGG
jgi:hypothetical protein